MIWVGPVSMISKIRNSKTTNSWSSWSARCYFALSSTFQHFAALSSTFRHFPASAILALRADVPPTWDSVARAISDCLLKKAYCDARLAVLQKQIEKLIKPSKKNRYSSEQKGVKSIESSEHIAKNRKLIHLLRDRLKIQNHLRPKHVLDMNSSLYRLIIHLLKFDNENY